MKFTLNPRDPEVARLVAKHLDGKMSYDALALHVAAIGYRTASLYELVRSMEAQREAKR